MAMPLDRFGVGQWQMQAVIQRFREAEIVDRLALPLLPGATCHRAEYAGAAWEVALETRDAPDWPDAVDGSLTFRLTGGRAESVNLGLELLVHDWSADTFLMLPAAAYDGNRFPVRRQEYPPIATDPEDVSPRPPTAITDVPRLSIRPGTESHLQILTGDETTPAITFYSPAWQEACILLVEQGSRFGNHGLHVLEDAARRNATLRVEAPAVRSQLYTMVHSDRPSWDRAATLAAPECLSLRFRLLVFPAGRVQDLYDRFAEVRQDVTGPVRLQHGLPFSAAWAIQERKLNLDNWQEEGYYAVGTHDQVERGEKYQDWQVGWVGGGMASYALLFQGQPDTRQRALRNLEWMFATGQAPSGLFQPVYHRGRFYSDHFRDPTGTPWVMVRKNADALYFLIKHFRLLEKQQPGWRPPLAWAAGTRRLADLFVRVFRTYGQLGQFLDLRTGDLVVGGSTAAAMAPAGLALAGEFFDAPEYVETAGRVADTLYERDVRAGVTTGGPGEILQCPDSESAFAMLESLVVLFEVTGDRRWLGRAAEMASQCATWCASYDYEFPAGSWLGRLGVRAAGSVWANVQNKHSAPGICTLSGDSLLKLWRATGHRPFLELLQTTAHNLTQYLSRADRPVGDPAVMRPGWMCERVNFSDWEGRENVGGSLFGSCWCEVSLLLTCVEVPGLYVQPDTGLVCAFDHVDVSVTGRRPDGVDLRVSNPTPFDASVKVLVENADTARTEPLGQVALWDCPVLDLPSGVVRRVLVSSDGHLTS